MDTVFSFSSSEGAYKVSARVGQYTLDECAVIPSGVPIHPYFLKSVDEDTDIQKLTVFLQTPYGEILSKKVTYIIDPDMETVTAEFDGSNSSDGTYKPNSGSGFTSDSGSASNSAFTPDTASSSDSSFTSDMGSASDFTFTADTGSSSDSSFTSDTGSASGSTVTPDTDSTVMPDTGSSSGSAVTSDSNAGANSAFISDSGSPANSGFSYDSLAPVNSDFTPDSGFTTEFNVVSGPGFTSESFFDASYADAYLWEAAVEEASQEEAYRFLKWGSIIQPAVSFDEDIIYVNKLSGILPPLLLPEDIEVGQYLLVFHIVGKKGVLNQIEKPFYYVGASEFTLDDIHVYLPGIFDKDHLVSPEIPVMLETKLAAGANLNPYVVWYNGKKQIHEGYVADGAARFIWRTPNQTGFHILRVEAFPFKPLNTGVQTPIGKIKELSLPVASKNENPVVVSVPAISKAGFSGQELIPVRHYQLFAELEDSQSFNNVRTALAAVNHVPEWLPQGNIFGLAVGPDHRFSIPGPLFTPVEEAEGHLLFRFVPLANGIIFSGSFKLNVRFKQEDNVVPFETFDMNLSYADGTVSLGYVAGSLSGEKNIYLLPGQTEGVITVVVSFEVQQDTLRLSLGLNAPANFLPDEGILLSGPFTGDGTFLLGSPFGETGIGDGTNVSSIQTMVSETIGDGGSLEASRASVTETSPLSPVVILDEFAVLIVPDISLNTVQAATEVSPSSTGSPEDVSAEGLVDDDDGIPQDFEETGDGTDGGFLLTKLAE